MTDRISDRCADCRFFGTETPHGAMPGVSLEHRRCHAPNVYAKFKPWRHPDNWCLQFEVKEKQE